MLDGTGSALSVPGRTVVSSQPLNNLELTLSSAITEPNNVQMSPFQTPHVFSTRT